jgi:hypothetical protein
MSEFVPICIYLVICLLASLIPLGVPFLFASNSSTLKRRVIPFLLLVPIIILFFIAVKLFPISVFFSKMEFLLCSRFISCLLVKMGCSGTLALVIGCALRAIFTTEATPPLGNWMLPDGTSGASSSSPVHSISSRGSSWIDDYFGREVGSSAPNQGGQQREDGASSQPTGVAGPSNALPSGQEDENSEPPLKRPRMDSGPGSGSGQQYLNVSSDTERRAAPEQGLPEQPPAHPQELEQPTLQDFNRLLASHEQIADTIESIFRDLHTRVPAGFQRERLTELLEERHGGGSLGEILRSLLEEGRNSPFFREVQADFKALRDSGGTEANLRKQWQGRDRGGL